MRRLICIMMLAALLLAGCGNRAAEPLQIPPGFLGCESELDGLILTPEQDIWSTEQKTLVFHWENNSGEEVYYGNHWQLEQLVDEQWQTVEFSGKIGFTAEAYLLADGGTAEYSVLLEALKKQPKQGLYRLVTSVYVQKTWNTHYQVKSYFALEQ